ncbi:MAG: ribonuclease D [Candidatus Melainabacteria bacterium]|nr:ribonuclease D [Candidatus Melainabacteria bacterium]
MDDKKLKLLEKDLTDTDLEFYLKQELVAVDCEMMGLNVYRDRLCLVQISDDDRNVRLVKIEQGQDLAPNLQKLFENENVLKLFHFARTDVAWLKFWLNIRVENYFCTKIASKIARTYTDKHGLKDLCKEVIGKDISKAQQSSDWGGSYLNKDQLNYAANDVYFLPEIYRTLRTMLVREGRLELAEKAIKCIDTMAELDNLGYLSILEH